MPFNHALYRADKRALMELVRTRDTALQSGNRDLWLQLNPQIRALSKRLRKFKFTHEPARLAQRTPERETAASPRRDTGKVRTSTYDGNRGPTAD
jgi:hypothetical protein